MIMDSKELIKEFTGFFETIITNVRKANHNDKDFIEVDFNDISIFNYKLSEELLERPVDVIEIMNLTLLKSYKETEESKALSVRLLNLPTTETIPVSKIRSNHIGKLIQVEGMIRRKTDIRPKLTHLEYLCTNPECTYSTERLKLPQITEKINYLKACSRCKAPVNIVAKIMVDNQNMLLEELTEHINTNSQTQKIPLQLQKSLTSYFSNSNINPGSKVTVIGLVKDVVKTSKGGGDTVNFDLIVEVNNIYLSDTDLDSLEISKEEEEQILEIASNENVLDHLVENFAPNIFGYHNQKEAILLSLFGGVTTRDSKGSFFRGVIHLLLVGDPGVAKSELLEAAHTLSPKGGYSSGKGSSGVGLIGAIVKDELTGSYALDAGLIVKCHKGNVFLDELEKMNEDDVTLMHQVMQSCCCDFNKANISARLSAETSITAAANPKSNRFDQCKDIFGQIAFPQSLISRFDVIFPMFDNPNTQTDEQIAMSIMGLSTQEKTYNELSYDFMRKYISYARKFNPIFEKQSAYAIVEFYKQVRSASTDSSVAITARYVPAIKRLAQAFARTELSKFVTIKHVKKATSLIEYSLKQMNLSLYDGSTQLIETGMSGVARENLKTIENILTSLSSDDVPLVHIKKIVEAAEKKKIDEKSVMKSLEKLKATGDVTEPKKNQWRNNSK